MSKLTIKKAVEAFLGLGFGEPSKPFRTQRDARDEAMRVVGFTQAQEQLRNLLRQTADTTGQQLAECPHHPDALRPMDGPGDIKMWVPPEYEVKRR